MSENTPGTLIDRAIEANRKAEAPNALRPARTRATRLPRTIEEALRENAERANAPNPLRPQPPRAA